MPLEIKGLGKKYDKHIIFRDFDITFKDNVINCILGASGCGKTTLLNIISGLDKYDQGEILGVENTTFSYIFQEPRILDWYTVEENMWYVMGGMDRDAALLRISRYLDVTGLTKFKTYYPGQLSGGMKQRLSIARAFAYPGKVLLMDEPFKGLDIRLKRELTDEFIRLWKEDKRTVLFVTHEPEEALMMADNIHIIGGEPCMELYKTELKSERDSRNSEADEIVKTRKMLYSFFID
ncbi:MAG TPA: ABC transporter ATP-binding protein [Clostridia bacterium]|nr:ABC transporter ATP-binding protein [Clostridia bacterium]HPQ47003.1 ABC transporter ATP-binding protein [Clostridia bacterium]